ncbi:Versiconal hemiacetal acetate esterase [Purpureocillium takamizusanense]|uniref:Versiconal hemiacetal acetate esterase n=1 Tax=Purpureocillium takamizusanense TaxID=2060973 RepID=A0A9Q8QCJ7_9HYPO|nr:Versiconal hemiacetal acetate esterase [Purpureocillium takamizusanense]UNI17155.1 Versiconal hemiacetal acetate esterase [Purpureocillium takamizusanense]
MEATLSPKWLLIEESLGGRPKLTGHPLDMRKQYKAFTDQANAMHVKTANVVVEDMVVSPHLSARVYVPVTSNERLLPVGLYYHGGGWCCGDLESEDSLCRLVSEGMPCVIISIGYRLAPEHKSPTQLNDAVDGWTWAFENASLWKGDQRKYFTIGQSAGGNLALAVANRLLALDRGPEIKGIVSVVPFVVHPSRVPPAYADMYQSFRANEDAPANTAEAMNAFLDAAEANPDDPDVFVLHSPHLRKFPPTYISVCGVDPLRDDGLIFDKVLRDLGVSTKLDHYEGLPHVFWAFGCEPPDGSFINDLLTGIGFVLQAES